MVDGLLSMVGLKLKSPPVQLGREGSLVVPPKLTPTKQKSLCDATGIRASVTLFRYVAFQRLYPCSVTGATELGYLHLRAFARSTRRSIRFLRFCLTFTNWSRYVPRIRSELLDQRQAL